MPLQWAIAQSKLMYDHTHAHHTHTHIRMRICKPSDIDFVGFQKDSICVLVYRMHAL